jgi:hypothetical protein
MDAAGWFIGREKGLYAMYPVTTHGVSFNRLTSFIERLGKMEPDTIGARVVWEKKSMVVMGRRRFLQSYAFKRAI